MTVRMRIHGYNSPLDVHMLHEVGGKPPDDRKQLPDSPSKAAWTLLFSVCVLTFPADEELGPEGPEGGFVWLV